MRVLLAVLRSLLARTRFEREMREELRIHIQHRADDLAASGVPHDEALRRARVEFGALESYKEQCRDASGFAPLRPLHGLGGDLRHAARRLAAAPLFTTFAILSLAVGVGLTTAVYSIVDSVLWKDGGVADPDRIVIITAADTAGSEVRWISSRPDYDDYRASQQSFERIAASHVIYPVVATTEATEIQQAEAVEGDYFRLLGVRAAIGRSILPEDDGQRASVVVLSHALWRSRFASDAAILGKTVRISGRPFEIVGVAAHDYAGIIPGPLRSTQFWIPLASIDESFALPSRGRDGRAARRLTILGRLAPGRSLDSARAEIAAFSAALDRAHPWPVEPRSGRTPARGWTPRTIAQLRAHADRDIGRFGVLVVVLVALVLLVACTNLSNLVLARGTQRHQEFAVRRALGASRWRLVREQCAESAILAALGGTGAYALVRVLVIALDTEIPIASNWVVSAQPEINASVLAVSVVAMVLSLLVFGLEPAMQLTRKAGVRDELTAASGSVGVPKTKRQHRLLRWQVAISAGFFIIAAMTVRYLAAEARHDSGIDLDRIAVAHLDFYLQRWDEPRARSAIARILEEAHREPGVQVAAVSSGLPFGTTISPSLMFAKPDDPNLTTGEREDAKLIIATPDFFRATGVRLLYGRGFDDRDDSGAPPVVMLSESTARRTFGTANAVGRRLLVKLTPRSAGLADEQPDTLVTVVGIAEDTDTTHFFRRAATATRPTALSRRPIPRG